MRIAVTTTCVPFIRGGAEMHAENLCTELRARGHEVELIQIPFKWYPPERIMDGLLACRLLDLESSSGKPIDKMIGLKFPAYHIKHPNPVLWILHPHRSAYDLWGTESCDLSNFPGGKTVRDAIVLAETELLGEVRKRGGVFTTSENNTKRIAGVTGIHAPPLYHPPPLARELSAGRGTELRQNFIFMPSRVNRLKRQLLAVQAMAHVSPSFHLTFCGGEEDAGYLRQVKEEVEALGLCNRVHFLGYVSDVKMVELFQKCAAVLYPPYDEDYGYVTLQAMLAGKPVITCTDSGGTLEFVDNKFTGLVAEPSPESLGKAIRTACDRSFGSELGDAGAASVVAKNITWDATIDTLLRS